MVLLTSSILFSLIFQVRSADFKFQTIADGARLQTNNSKDILTVHFNTRSLVHCASLCANNRFCQTTDFDTVTRHCRLFRVSFDQSLVIRPPQAPFTSYVLHIQNQLDHYALFNKTCNPSLDYSRFLVCESNARWNCPAGTFWNGNKCEIKHGMNETCFSSSWCDDILGLTCLLACQICSCNHSTTWNGSSCVPSELYI